MKRRIATDIFIRVQKRAIECFEWDGESKFEIHRQNKWRSFWVIFEKKNYKIRTIVIDRAMKSVIRWFFDEKFSFFFSNWHYFLTLMKLTIYLFQKHFDQLKRMKNKNVATHFKSIGSNHQNLIFFFNYVTRKHS